MPNSPPPATYMTNYNIPGDEKVESNFAIVRVRMRKSSKRTASELVERLNSLKVDAVLEGSFASS